MNSAPRLLGAALLALVAAWGGMRLYLQYAAPHEPITVPVGIASAPSPSDLEPPDGSMPGLAANSANGKVPAQLPDFALHDLNDTQVPISRWQGRSLVINFWATWCPPCKREIPLLKSIAAQWEADQVTVLGIAVDHRDKVRQFAEQFKIAYPLLVGEQDGLEVAAKFGMETPAFPFTVFTDRRGEVITLYVGELNRPQTDLILATIRELNAARIGLDDARKSIALGLAALPKAS